MSKEELGRLTAGRNFVQATLAQTLIRAEAAEERARILAELARAAISQIGDSHGIHWDPTGMHGGGCQACADNRDRRQQLLADLERIEDAR